MSSHGAVSFSVADQLTFANRQLTDRVTILEIELERIKQLVADRLALQEKDNTNAS